jgi:arrestin-related trafficking adapter 3/6
VAKETPVLFELWNLKQDESEGRKEETQLLPIVSDSDDALLSSPLLEYMVPTEYNSAMQDAEGSSSTVDMDAATDFLGPGPWKLAHTMPLPHCDLVVPSFTNPAGGIGRANMEVKHTVKIVMRVERGDDKHLDKKGRRKRWDIVVQIGVQMLAVSRFIESFGISLVYISVSMRWEMEHASSL